MRLGTLSDHQYKDGMVRDGTPQHSSKSCEHHGGCKWCEGNRTFSTKKIAIQIKDEILNGD